MKLAAVIASIVLALAGRASAQPGTSASAQPGTSAPAQPGTSAPAPVPATAPAPEPRPAGSGGPSSERTALALSIGGTLGSWGLLIASSGMVDDRASAAIALGSVGALGAVLGPSFGHWYAGKVATRGLGLRVGGIGSALLGLFLLVTDCPLDHEETLCDSKIGLVTLIGGAGLFLGGTIDDIVTAPRRVRRRNQRLAGVALAPMVTPRSAGLALGGWF